MFKRKPSRSREFKRNSQVIDMNEAREARRKRREERALEEELQRKKEEERKLSARKRRQRRNRILVYIAAILLIIVILVASAWNIISLQVEKSQLEKEQEALIKQRDAMQEELENVNDPEYVEQQARQQLRLIMPGETLYVLPSLPKQGEVTEPAIER